MAVVEVFEHPEMRRYKSSICSKAILTNIILALLMWISPLLIIYSSGGLWTKVSQFNEQPNVHFKYQLIVILTTDSAQGSFVTWSTYQNYNQLQMQNLRIPVVQTSENDANGDGRYDQLNFQLSMPLTDTERVTSVQLMLFFDYILETYSYFEMESMVYVSADTATSAAALDVTGDLALTLRTPLDNSGVDTRYNTSIINPDSIYASSFSMVNILNSYKARNATTWLANSDPVWTSIRGAGEPFIATVIVNYDTQYSIMYYTMFWDFILEGWVKFMAVFALFWYTISCLKVFIYENQLVTTIVERPFRNKAL